MKKSSDLEALEIELKSQITIKDGAIVWKRRKYTAKAGDPVKGLVIQVNRRPVLKSEAIRFLKGEAGLVVRPMCDDQKAYSLAKAELIRSIPDSEKKANKPAEPATPASDVWSMSASLGDIERMVADIASAVIERQVPDKIDRMDSDMKDMRDSLAIIMRKLDALTNSTNS